MQTGEISRDNHGNAVGASLYIARFNRNAHALFCTNFAAILGAEQLVAIIMTLFFFYKMAAFVFSDCSSYLHESGKHGAAKEPCKGKKTTSAIL